MKKLNRVLFRPAEKIMQRMPVSWKSFWFRKIKKIRQGQFYDSEQELERQTVDFIKKEIVLLFWGALLLFLLFIILVGGSCFAPENRRYERNSFGAGEIEIPLILEKDGTSKTYSLQLEEQRLSAEELNQVFSQFFKDLEENIKGKNTSLEAVTQSLVFEDSLEGYPFEISYEPEDSSYISWDGKPGDAFALLEPGESLSTGILVTAEYGAYCRSNRYEVHLVKTESRSQRNVFLKTMDNLRNKEKETRENKSFLLPEKYREVTIKPAGEEKPVGILFLLGIVILIFVPVHNYTELKEEEKRCREETVEDFPVIVHLLTLYMGAGLSFASSVRRISEDYQKRQRKKKKKYAFEEILRMNRQMQMGVSQKEACISWGKRFQETMYHKLSFTLIQTISKGTREARTLMENTEKNAFLQRVDRAKKAGEEAATRLLFPMMVLLCLVMVLIMFPAFLRFRGF